MQIIFSRKLTLVGLSFSRRPVLVLILVLAFVSNLVVSMCNIATTSVQRGIQKNNGLRYSQKPSELSFMETVNPIADQCKNPRQVRVHRQAALNGEHVAAACWLRSCQQPNGPVRHFSFHHDGHGYPWLLRCVLGRSSFAQARP